MTTFDRHLMRRLLTGYVLFVLALIVFFIVLHYVEYVDDFLDRGATLRDVFAVYYPSYVPEIVRLTSPLALFLSAVYLTGRLAQQLQLMALQMSGVSLYRLLRPYLVVALVLTGFMFWFNGWVVPRTNATVLRFDLQYLKDAPQQLDVSDIHRQNAPGSILTVGYYDGPSQTGHRVSLQRFEDARHLAERLDAPRMVWVDSLGRWRFEEATLRRFDADGLEVRQSLPHVDTLLNVQPRDLARTERDVESMTLPDARAYVAALRRSGAGSLGRTLVGYYGKFAYPFANLIVVLLAVPLAAVRRRGGQTVQMGLGLLLAFAYLAVMKIVEPFGYAGDVPPVVAATAAHAAFLLLALCLLATVRK